MELKASTTQQTLPHSVEAEKSVLGSMMLSRDAADYAVELLDAQDFYSPAHQDIFSAMCELNNIGKPVDSVTVIEKLSGLGKIVNVGGGSYITELTYYVPSASNIEHYAQIVQEHGLMRQLHHAGSDIAKASRAAEKPASEILDDAERRIFNISMKKAEDSLVHIEESAMNALVTIGELAKLKGALSGVPTGFTELDNLTSGLQKSDLLVVAGRPSMGKTAFALNIAQYAATRGKKSILVFSLEMSREQLAMRMLCAEAGVDMHRVKTGKTSSDEMMELAKANDVIGSSNIYLDDTAGISVAEIRSRCRRQKTRPGKGLDMVIIDYLQLMKTSGNTNNRVTEISEITRALKILARELEVPVMLLSQLSRGPESRADHRPMMADLRESGAIEQDADVVMLLYRPAVYADKDDQAALDDNSAEIIVAKHRNGPTGTIHLAWVDKYAKFTGKASFNER